MSLWKVFTRLHAHGSEIKRLDKLTWNHYAPTEEITASFSHLSILSEMSEHNQVNTSACTHTHTYSLTPFRIHYSTQYTLFFTLLPPRPSVALYSTAYMYCRLTGPKFDGHLVSNFLLQWITLYIHFIHFHAHL